MKMMILFMSVQKKHHQRKDKKYNKTSELNGIIEKQYNRIIISNIMKEEIVLKIIYLLIKDNDQYYHEPHYNY